ncbi:MULTISPECIES: GtrA family protein [Pseudomonas]|uniref:GtrA family protein n=1 Tax=Pseudomonas TaxID=286 RepID=UPI001C830E9A|nr:MULTISPECIES: GtrA family protein [Pseudomonas]MDI1332968.1 GtrA family protein [Pseudomonas sp.]MDO8709895.1 GtrA family protein [Pseudomonas sp.]QZA98424.1 GtrA family protein [Pseudomonas mandelii]
MRKSLGKLPKKKTIIELVRYGVIGLITNFLGYLIYFLITYYGGTPKITMSVLYAVGTAISFISNRKWTFSHDGNLMSAGARYIFAHSLGYALNLSLLIIMVDHLGYPHQWVQVISIFAVAGFLFLMFKFFVFPKKLINQRGEA